MLETRVDQGSEVLLLDSGEKKRKAKSFINGSRKNYDVYSISERTCRDLYSVIVGTQLHTDSSLYTRSFFGSLPFVSFRRDQGEDRCRATEGHRRQERSLGSIHMTLGQPCFLERVGQIVEDDVSDEFFVPSLSIHQLCAGQAGAVRQLCLRIALVIVILENCGHVLLRVALEIIKAVGQNHGVLHGIHSSQSRAGEHL